MGQAKEICSGEHWYHYQCRSITESYSRGNSILCEQENEENNPGIRFVINEDWKVLWVIAEEFDELKHEMTKLEFYRKDDYEVEEKKQVAADVLFQYSNFVMACIGNQVRPCNLRLHLMKEVSGLPTSLKQERRAASSPNEMGESSSLGTSRLETDSFKGL
ncbi:uncharacterized protein [Solanum tuberosum]|uniref:uncharacterized protein n=1 Tax=Solanum tuberosum TaxID=4113 RepID=UPI0003D24276|nr:PREDICTED: uncharacterized protein LOC102605793 [Solanum tuberosum]